LKELIGKTKVQQWEYLFWDAGTNDTRAAVVNDILKDKGLDGWELVQLLYHMTPLTFIFKRPLP